MNLPDGPVAVLSTIVVAGLAVGLGYGAHAILKEEDIGASPTTAPTNAALSDDFCTLMGDMVVYTEEMDEAMLGSGFMFGMEDASEAEQLNNLHEFGQVMADVTGTLGDYLLRGSELVTDPDVAAAFVQLADGMEALGMAFGTAAVEAESLEAYEAAMEVLSADPEFLAAMDGGDTAEPIIETYVLEECGINLSGEAQSSVDDNLQADASSLGMEVALYYDFYEDGATQPVLTVEGGQYLLDGFAVAAVSEGVILTDSFFLSPEEWCVEVALEEDPTVIRSYSAIAGLGEATCASLQP